MSDPKAKPRSTEDILREMEDMSRGTDAEKSPPRQEGALKSLLNFFIKVVPEEESPAPEKGEAPNPASAPPAQRVADLVGQEGHPEFAAPSDDAGDLAARSFDDIYLDAGFPETPCTVEDLAALMENPTIASQPLSVKTVAVNLALSAKGVGVDVPIADAVRRDRALDAYQRMLSDRVHDTEARNAEKIQRLTEETEEFLRRKQAEIDALRAETAEAKRQAVDFSLRREVEEKRLADLIAPFLQGRPNPVTVGANPEDVLE